MSKQEVCSDLMTNPVIVKKIGHRDFSLVLAGHNINYGR